MVGALKRWLGRWLGIERLEDENLSLANALLSLGKRIKNAESDAKKALEVSLDVQKCLTTQPAKPKIVPKPQRLTWRGTVAAIERENAKQEEA